MIKIRVGNQINKYLGKGDIDFPEIFFHQDDVLKIASTFLIAGRSRNIVINTRDAMLVEAFEVLTNDNDGQITFLLDDSHEDKIIKEEIKPDELYILYDTMARGYRKINRYRIYKKHYLNG